MERPLAIAGFAVLLAIIILRLRAELRGLGARPAAYVVVAALVIAVLSSMALAILDVRFTLSLFIAYGILFVLWLSPLRLISLTGGPIPLVGLAKAHHEIRRLINDASSDPVEMASLPARLDALSKWHDAETSEYIDLVRDRVRRWLAGQPEPDDVEETIRHMDEMEASFMQSLAARGVDISKIARTSY